MLTLAVPAPAPRAELDDVTLARAKRGDDDACRALVERYQRPVFAVLRRMLGGPPELVEDLAQETFLRVFRALPDFKVNGPAKLSSWILTIASRLAIDTLRKRPREPEALEHDDLPSTLSSDLSARRRELASAIEKAARHLTPEQRLVFVLSVCEGKPHDEIAAICDVDVGTVKSRLSRARATLREQLAPLADADTAGAP
jgi:RNA polymerase sigma-70 factor (ECF subfamily)